MSAVHLRYGPTATARLTCSMGSVDGAGGEDDGGEKGPGEEEAEEEEEEEERGAESVIRSGLYSRRMGHCGEEGAAQRLRQRRHTTVGGQPALCPAEQAGTGKERRGAGEEEMVKGGDSEQGRRAQQRR